MKAHDLSKLRIASDQKAGPAAKPRRRWIVWSLLVAAGVIAIAFLGWTGRLSRSVEVHTYKVSPMFPSKALTVLNASGYVVAQRKASVASKATGRLQELHVEEGKRVKENDVLAVLENKDLMGTVDEARAALKVAKAALEIAEAELDEATLIFERNKSLRESGAVSQQAFEAAEARYKKALADELRARFGVNRAEAALRTAEVNLEYSYIRAPFDGVILTKNADVGEVVAPFGAAVNARAAVVSMADMSSLMVEVDVSESSLEKVKVGGATEIALDALPHDRFPGRVHMIVPTADRAKATVLTKVKFDRIDEKVLPEMSAKVAFLTRPLKEDEHKPFLAIPVSAVATAGNKEVVFRIEGNQAHEVAVTTARQWGDSVEVIAGLKEGDMIVLKPDASLREGRRVAVKE